MSLNNFILECERNNRELTKNLNYYKNCSNRLLFENQQLKEQLEQKEDMRNRAIGHVYACGKELSKDECRYLLEILNDEGDKSNENN